MSPTVLLSSTPGSGLQPRHPGYSQCPNLLCALGWASFRTLSRRYHLIPAFINYYYCCYCIAGQENLPGFCLDKGLCVSQEPSPNNYNNKQVDLSVSKMDGGFFSLGAPGLWEPQRTHNQPCLDPGRLPGEGEVCTENENEFGKVVQCRLQFQLLGFL